jgi:hypothetical protein
VIDVPALSVRNDFTHAPELGNEGIQGQISQSFQVMEWHANISFFMAHKKGANPGGLALA